MVPKGKKRKQFSAVIGYLSITVFSFLELPKMLEKPTVHRIELGRNTHTAGLQPTMDNDKVVCTLVPQCRFRALRSFLMLIEMVKGFWLLDGQYRPTKLGLREALGQVFMSSSAGRLCGEELRIPIWKPKFWYLVVSGLECWSIRVAQSTNNQSRIK